MSKVTAKQVRDLIESRIEDVETPDIALDFFRENTGKRLDKRLLAKLNKATGISFSYNRQYGYTQLEWGGYSLHAVKGGGKITIANTETSAVVPKAEWIENENPAYFEGAKNRNAVRNGITPEEYKEMAKAINDHANVISRLKKMFAYGAPFNHDSGAIQFPNGIRIEKWDKVEGD